MSNNAPVCEITPQIITDQPLAKQFPPIPAATDLPSALAAIAALTAILRQLANLQPQRFFPPLSGGVSGASTQTPPTKPGRYQEVLPQRVTTKAVVHSSEDPNTTLTFKRIDRIIWVDTKTGEQIPWSRNAP